MTKEIRFNQMINQYDNLIMGLAHKYNVLDYSYEDCYQECLTKLWNELDKYNSKYAMTTFINIVCKNHLITLNNYMNNTMNSNYINNERQKDIKGYDFSILINNPVYTQFELDVLYDCLELLEDNKFKYIIVDILNGYTNKEVANKHNVSKQYVNKKYRDFIKNCRNLVDIRL